MAVREAVLGHEGDDVGQCRIDGRLVMDDAALADILAAHFELWLEQDHGIGARFAQRQRRGEDLGDRDKADIGDQQVEEAVVIVVAPGQAGGGVVLVVAVEMLFNQ